MSTLHVRNYFAGVLMAILLAGIILVLPGRAGALDATELIEYFIEELSPYGRWENQQPYGRVWAPAKQDNDWRPYSQGHWVNSESYGWVWRPDEEWGEIPYHYGRWANSNNRWFWVPDDTWGPAWVDWREDDEYIGWSPMPPEANWSWHDEWRPSHSTPVYARDSYSFVPRRHFTAPGVRSYFVPRSQVSSILQRSRNITLYRTVNQTVINDGPRYDLIERLSNLKQPRIHYEPRSIRGRSLPVPFSRHEKQRIKRQREDNRALEHARAIEKKEDMRARLRESEAEKYQKNHYNSGAKRERQDIERQGARGQPPESRKPAGRRFKSEEHARAETVKPAKRKRAPEAKSHQKQDSPARKAPEPEKKRKSGKKELKAPKAQHDEVSRKRESAGDEDDKAKKQPGKAKHSRRGEKK